MHKIDINKLANEIGADILNPLPSDVSPRKYFRGSRGNQNFIIMLYPEANDDNRKELSEFIRIGRWLGDKAIKVPELYLVNEEKCMAKFEDLGTTSFGKLLKLNNNKQKNLYKIATDILIELSKAGMPDDLPVYNDSKIHKDRRQIVDYYLPLLNKNADISGYLNAWQEIERSLPPCPQGFVHGDYHLENLIYVNGEQGVKKCALIDYQDALYGPLPYDLVNLLEDARVDIPDDLRQAMIDRYCAGMSAQEKDIFLKWYRVLGTQFHCRVIGLFIKLSAEQGRDDYLIHTQRLQNYIKNALQDPVLLPLKSWFENEAVAFDPINDLNGSMIRSIFTS